MKCQTRLATVAILFIALSLALCFPLSVQTQPAVPNSPQKAAILTNHAKGTFEVKLAPLTSESDPALGRMSIDKQLHGDL